MRHISCRVRQRGKGAAQSCRSITLPAASTSAALATLQVRHRAAPSLPSSHQVSGRLEQLGYQRVASATLGSEVGPMIGCHRFRLDQFGMQCSDLCLEHSHGRMIVTR
jgi:hypothetical protein